MDSFENKDQVVEALVKATQLVATPDFSSSQSEATEILSKTCDFVKQGHGTFAEFVPQLKEVLYACLEHGPNAGHVEVVDRLLCGIELRDTYIKEMQGDDIKRFINSMKVTVKPPEAEDVRDYLRNFKSVFEDMLSYFGRGSEDRVADSADLMADLYLFFMKQVNISETDRECNVYGRLCAEIEKLYRERGELWKYMYSVQKDATLLLQHLEEFKSNVSHSDFQNKVTKFEGLGRWYKNWLDLLVAPLVGKVKYALSNIQAYGDLINAILDSSSSEHLTFLKEITYSIDRNPAKVSKNMKVSTEKLVPMIENAEPKDYKTLCQVASCLIGQKFEVGQVVDGAFEILTAMIKTEDRETCERAKRILDDGDKVKTKTHGAGLCSMMEAVIDISVKLGDADAWKNKCYGDVAEWIMKKAVKYNNLTELNTILVKGVIDVLTHPKDYSVLHNTMSEVCEHMDWKLDFENLQKCYGLYASAIKEHGDSFDVDEHRNFMNMVIKFMQAGAEAITESPDVAGKFSADVATCLQTVTEAWVKASEDEEEFLMESYKNQLYLFARYIDPMCQDASFIAPFIPLMLTLMDSGPEDVGSVYSAMMMMIGQRQPAALAESIPAIIAYATKLGEQATVTHSLLLQVYPHGADTFHAELENLLNLSIKYKATWPMMIYQIVTKIIAKHPEAIKESHVKIIMSMILFEHMGMMIYASFLALSKSHPAVLLPTLDELVEHAYSDLKDAQAMIPPILGTLGRISQEQAEKQVAKLLELMPKTAESNQDAVINNVKDIGSVFPSALPKHKETITAYRDKYPLSAEECQAVLDMIEGRTLAGLSENIEDQKVEIDNVKSDIVATNEKVDTVNTKVDQQGRDLEHVKEDVTKVEERLDDVEETVEDTVQKVEEVDRKTMSNAPAWARDVSILLNPEAEHDWRLLGQRLGYSNDDIRGWATQNDPCMALLSEWFATHKTREATHGVLKALEEMHREDAAVIVRKAKEEADAVLEDDDEEDTGPLPPVFLSYQWGHQPHVKLLKRHLEMAGFGCWMDTGQMGGGDKLFAKIDAGMRAASVIVCCISEKYAKSENCTREVNLAVNLGKPIIPLLMENMKWPPEGAMGPIFGEYLFIRFNQRAGEETDDDRFWPAAKFEELLMQLRYNIVPNEDLVTEEYRNWWNPQQEQIVIPQATKSESGSGGEKQTKAENTEDADSGPLPEVFLSYQWGKQPQIKALFGRLSGLGYSCWMDIYQMGGGDSLYEKIDKGVRNAKVVVSCVTPKYALSANCRREVSLADALKKPIIPLLLDEMTWPPEGPMSMVMTQLLYISFVKDPESQLNWTGDKMDELLQKLNESLPHMMPRTDDVPTPAEPEKKEPEQPAEAAPVAKEPEPQPERVTSGKGRRSSKQAERASSGKSGRGSKQATPRTEEPKDDKPKSKSKSCVIL